MVSGDKVKLVDECYWTREVGLVKGNTYTVKRISGGGCMYIRESKYMYYTSQFERVNDYMTKIEDNYVI